MSKVPGLESAIGVVGGLRTIKASMGKTFEVKALEEAESLLVQFCQEEKVRDADSTKKKAKS